MFFDPDNTHDRLFAQKIDQRCINLIAEKLGNHSPFEAGQPFPVTLVEREAPGNPQASDQWASNWTEIYFDLLKPLSRTFILTDGFLNGSAYGFEPEYQAGLPESLSLDDWPDEIKITVPKEKTAQISWIEKAHPEVQSAPFCDKVSNNISVWMRRTILLTAPKNEDLEWIMPPNNADYLLHNSLVITGDGTLGENGDLVEANNLNTICESILDGLALPPCKVLTGYTGTLIRTFNGPASFLEKTKQNPVFSTVPDNYYYVYFEKESNSLGQKITFIVVENIITLEVGYIYTFFDAGGDFVINDSGFVFDYPVPNNPTGLNPYFGFVNYPLLNVIEGNYDLDMYLFSFTTDPNPTARTKFTQLITGGKPNFTISEQDRVSSGIDPTSTTDPVPLYTVTNASVTINTRLEIFGILNDDPNLFSSYEIGFASANTQIKAESVGVYNSDFVSTGISSSREHFGRRFSTIFSVSFQENAEQSPTIQNSYLQWSNTLGTDVYPTGTVETSIFVSRSIGTNNNPPDLVIGDDEISIFRGEEATNLLTEILYPDGIENPSILDPDTDNGDIMPDSIRLKEIHAALEADRYGVHPGDPEKKRLNNLGRLMEVLAYATGIAFNEDGKNIPQPAANWVDSEYIATINANQSLRNGQFAVREVTDAYGQRMVCDALFEVRSSQVTTETDDDGNLQVASVKPGGAMRSPHILGIYDSILDDVTRLWGGGDIMVPKVDGTGVAYYDSMSEALADTLYMLGSHSKSINELQNQSIKTVFLLQEILRALGLPCHVATVQGEGGVMPCPELDEQSPTLTSLLGLVLINLSRVVGGSIAFREDNQAPIPAPTPPSEGEPGGGGVFA